MSQPADDTNSTTDGLWRWLLGGLAAGGVILGLLIAAYAVGYHRGQHHSARSSDECSCSDHNHHPDDRGSLRCPPDSGR